MVAGTRAALATPPTLVLEQVMPELVGKDVAQHEAPQAVSRP